MKLVTLLLCAGVLYIGMHLVFGLKNIDRRAQISVADKMAVAK